MEQTKVPALVLKMQVLKNNMTTAEQRVVDTIIEHPQDVIYASVAELAERSKVSDPTVIRTCKKLGFNGYQDLKITLAKELVNPLQAINENISPEDDSRTVAAKTFQSIIQTLKLTHDTLNIPDIEKAVASIVGARKVEIIGVGNSHGIALDLQHKLLRLGIDAIAFSDPHMAAVCLAYMTEEDLLFCISHSGSSREIVDLAQQGKNKGVQIISLSNIGVSPLSKLSDTSLHTVSNETHYRIIGLDSRIAQLAVIDTIYNLISMQKTDEDMLQVENAMKGRKY